MVFLKASCVPIAFFHFDEVLPCLTAAFVVFLHGKFLGHIEAGGIQCNAWLHWEAAPQIYGAGSPAQAIFFS